MFYSKNRWRGTVSIRLNYKLREKSKERVIFEGFLTYWQPDSDLNRQKAMVTFQPFISTDEAHVQGAF